MYKTTLNRNKKEKNIYCGRKKKYNHTHIFTHVDVNENEKLSEERKKQ